MMRRKAIGGREIMAALALAAAALMAVSALVSGCASRRHIREDQGDSVHAAFGAQASPAPEGAPAAPGLDPEEARIVYENYRDAMKRTKASSRQAPPSGIIVVDEDGKARTAK